MGACVNSPQTTKKQPNILQTVPASWSQNSQKEKNKKTDKYVQLRKSLPNDLKVKVPKKRTSKQDPFMHEKLSYTIDHGQTSMEMKINIRKTSESLEQGKIPTKWMLDDGIEILDRVNQEYEINLESRLEFEPVILDINEILINAIYMSQIVRSVGVEKKHSLTNDSDLNGVEFDRQEQIQIN